MYLSKRIHHLTGGFSLAVAVHKEVKCWGGRITGSHELWASWIKMTRFVTFESGSRIHREDFSTAEKLAVLFLLLLQRCTSLEKSSSCPLWRPAALMPAASCHLSDLRMIPFHLFFNFYFLALRRFFFMNVRTFPMGTRKRPLDFIREKIFIAVSSKYRINTVQNITHRDDRLFTRFMLHSRALLITNTQRQVKYRCWSLLLNVIKF